tara:strand:- start:1188 stop:1430 length:243 start_codon:yes stop_codon:yes gene_type:complete
MFLSNFEFYNFDLQAVVIIIATICLALAINKYIEKNSLDGKKYNETLVLVISGILGFFISLIVSYSTIEPDNLDTSDYYN